MIREPGGVGSDPGAGSAVERASIRGNRRCDYEERIPRGVVQVVGGDLGKL